MKKGFTLIEILVSVAIFSVAMVIALGALLAMSESDRKAESLKSVINNLNFSLDSMSRAIRTGYNYHCGNLSGQDCAGGANEFVFTPAQGPQTYYRLDSTNGSLCGQTAPNIGCIERSTDGTNWSPLTSPEVVIQDFSNPSNAAPPSYLFYVVGSIPGSSGDKVQPKVNITLSGYVQVTPTQRSLFYLQTTVTQRLYDQ